MIPEIALVTIELIALTQLDGRVAYVNPLQILKLEDTHSAHGRPNKQFTDEVHCVVTLSSGTYITVRENCHEIRKLFTGIEEQRR